MVVRRADRQRATFLAASTLALAIISLPLSFYVVLALRDQRAAVGLVYAGLLLICYAVSRTRYANWGSIMLVAGQTVLGFAALFTLVEPAAASALTAFLLVPVLFAIMLLPARWTLTLAVVINITLGGYAVVKGSMDSFYLPLIVMAVISTIAAVVAFVRERDLITIEQQASELARRSSSSRADSDDHTRSIEITADIARMMTGARDVSTMLRQVASLIVERFKFYHVQIFLVDASGKQARLQAASGAAGDQLMASGHSLLLNIESVVTRVINRGEVVTVHDTDIDPIHRRNELLPHTRSEIGLPLRVSGQVIGALNIQSAEPNAFNLSDTAVFQTIADQLAISIENARLFERAQRDLADIETLNRQLTGDAWSKYLTGRAANSPLGFASSAGRVTAIDAADAAETEADAGTISLPLKIRGETIGLLDVTSRTGETPDNETRSMLEAVAERVALALDSTRLGEQAQRQAEREQILSKISADLQATTDMNAILRITARESSKALGAARSFVHLTMEYSKDKAS